MVIINKIISFLNLYEKVINFLYPPKCYLCFTKTQSFHLCATCYKDLSFYTNNGCAKCGYPFPNETRKDLLCGNCIKNEPLFEQATHIFKFDKVGKELIHNFKYKDKLNLAKLFAPWIKNNIENNNFVIDYAVAVPIHKSKLFIRKYNQSAILCNLINNFNGIKSLPHLLVKTKNTKPQIELSKEKRLENVKGVFAINKDYIKDITNKNILLIDDVYTTGATVNECTKILKKYNCNKVFVLTLAKTYESI